MDHLESYDATSEIDATDAVDAIGRKTEPELSQLDRETEEDVSKKQPTPSSLLLSTLLSLTAILVLLTSLRFLLPSTLEFSRYSWYRGQLRAEYDVAGEQLQLVSNSNLPFLSQTVARRVCPSVVHITLDRLEADKDEGSKIAKSSGIRSFLPPLVGQGSGVIVDARGYILTNYHVINDEANRVSTKGRINVALADERTCKAELIGFDAFRDLAVLKIEADDLFPVSWGDSEQLEVGAPVWAVGSPFGLSGSITFGILSGKHRLDLSGTSYDEQKLPVRDRHIMARYSDLMQSDVAVNPGNSGGPLVNGKGELVGINTAIIGEAYRGVSFSIPSNIAKIVFDQILESGRMRRGWLGVELVRVADWKNEQEAIARMEGFLESSEVDADQDQEATDLKQKTKMATHPIRGAVIRSIVSDDAPAAVAGLQVGDIILKLNDKSIKGVEDLIFEISKSPIGSEIQLTIDRDNQTSVVKAIVGERP